MLTGPFFRFKNVPMISILGVIENVFDFARLFKYRGLAETALLSKLDIESAAQPGLTTS